MPPLMDLAGLSFHRWTVLYRTPNKSSKRSTKTSWMCQCVCGTLKSVSAISLCNGTSKSCGCLKAEQDHQRFLTHGLSQTPEFAIWRGMKQRCYNAKTRWFRDYGARGIGMCPAWRNSFPQFYADMGPRPSPSHSIERRENNADYNPTNCYWTTPGMQQRNKRSNRLLTFEGRTLCITAWAEIVGIKTGTLQSRLDAGWSVAHALCTPILSRRQRHYRQSASVSP